MRGIITLGLGLMFSAGVFGGQLTFAQGFSLLQTVRVGSGFQRPLFVAGHPALSNQVFVVEQHTGRIRILTPATREIEPEPFLTVSGITTSDEQGLLGFALHPDYLSNGWFYVNYTTSGGGPAGHTEIARFRVQGDPRTSKVADPSSKSIILIFNQPEANHNGGWLGFGKDGYLYASTGDGGGGNDQHGSIGNGQNRNTLLGKILRIDINQPSGYAIPDGNPFAGVEGQRGEIWAFGLRNPWRCSFDRLTGDLWIGDVGQSSREEIDVIPAGTPGLNFGWRPREGSIQNPAFPSESPVTAPTGPVHDYGRNDGVSVIGGYVYRGGAIPDLQGTYLFADYGSARFWSFRLNGTNRVEFLERTSELNSGNPKPIRNPSGFGEDAAGELYVCDIADGEIYKITTPAPAVIQLSNPGITNSVFYFNLAGEPGQRYLVEATSSLTNASWLSVTNITAAGAAANLLISDPADEAQRYYRVRASTGSP